MSRDVAGKIARGEDLDEFEIVYARDRGLVVSDQPGGDEGEEIALDDLTKRQLLAMAQERGLDLPAGWNKSEIIDALTEADDEEADE